MRLFRRFSLKLVHLRGQGLVLFVDLGHAGLGVAERRLGLIDSGLAVIDGICQSRRRGDPHKGEGEQQSRQDGERTLSLSLQLYQGVPFPFPISRAFSPARTRSGKTHRLIFLNLPARDKRFAEKDTSPRPSNHEP